MIGVSGDGTRAHAAPHELPQAAKATRPAVKEIVGIAVDPEAVGMGEEEAVMRGLVQLAPNAAAVSVIGDFNGWDRDAHPLDEPGEHGQPRRDRDPLAHSDEAVPGCLAGSRAATGVGTAVASPDAAAFWFGVAVRESPPRVLFSTSRVPTAVDCITIRKPSAP
mgnify:CR=1 FL=1